MTSDTVRSPAEQRRRLLRSRYLLLAVLLAGFAVLKTHFDPVIGRRMMDGSYYLQLAQHVRDGDGLVSHVSLYYQGFKEMPHRVNQAPLWVLMLGYGGRVFDINRVATQGPELLYLLNLLLVYHVGRRLWERTGGDGWVFRRERVFDFGHLSLLFLGLNPLFFRFTSLPYTEGLAFAFGFAAFLALDRADTRSDARWAVAAGAIAGLALLTRAQMVGIALAVPLALAIPRVRKGGSVRLFASASAGLLVVMLPWVVYLSTWIDELSLRTAIGLAEIRETPELAAFAGTTQLDSMGAFLLDRAAGFWHALHPTSLISYVRQLGFALYVLPAGVLYLALTARSDPTDLRRASGSALFWALGIAAIVMLGPVHLSHNTFFREWLFGHRHGIPLLLFALPVFAALDRSRDAWVPTAAAAVVALGLAGIGSDTYDLISNRHVYALKQSEHALVEWLNQQDPPPAVISTKAQRLAPFTRAGLHWTLCSAPPEQTIAQLEHTGADYVVAYYRDRACPFIDGRYYRWHTVATLGKRSKILILEYQPRR